MKKLACILVALMLLCGCVSCGMAETETYVLSTLQFNVPDTWIGGFQEGSDDSNLVLTCLSPFSYYLVQVSYMDIGKMTGISNAKITAEGLRMSAERVEEIHDVSDVSETNGFQWFSCTYDEGIVVVAIDPNAKNVLRIISDQTTGIRDILNMITVRN